MRYLLENFSASSKLNSITPSPAFTEWDHCILINTAELGTLKSIRETIYPDRTGLEASINHVHVNDLETGIQIIDQWKLRLQEDYSDKEFIIVLSCQADGEDVVVRFYQYREDEPAWVDLNNLECYEEEAILVFEIMDAAL